MPHAKKLRNYNSKWRRSWRKRGLYEIKSYGLFNADGIDASLLNQIQKQNADSTTSVNPSHEAFLTFLKKFKPLSFPVTIRTLAIVVDSSKKLNKADNRFIKSEYPDEIYAYGILPDTANSYKIIWLEPAEIEVPVLTTFTKSGEKINEEELGVGGCGSDCGFQCKEFIEIKNDMTIFSVDSETDTECDTNGNLIEGTTKKLIRYKTGKVLSNGNISLSKILQRLVK